VRGIANTLCKNNRKTFSTSLKVSLDLEKKLIQIKFYEILLSGKTSFFCPYSKFIISFAMYPGKNQPLKNIKFKFSISAIKIFEVRATIYFKK